MTEYKKTRDILLLQKEALLSRIRAKMPHEVEELEETLDALAGIDQKGVRLSSVEFAGMKVIDAMSLYFSRIERPATEAELIKALLSGGVGLGKGRDGDLAVKESIRVWSGKGRLLVKGGLIWPAEWGPEPPGQMNNGTR